jgi:hypothetical protein
VEGGVRDLSQRKEPFRKALEITWELGEDCAVAREAKKSGRVEHVLNGRRVGSIKTGVAGNDCRGKAESFAATPRASMKI